MNTAANSVIRVDHRAVAPARKLLRWSALDALLARRRSRSKPKLPSILVVTVPKSGTRFTNLTLSGGLGLEPTSVSFGYFPHYLVDIPKLPSFIEGGSVASAHFDPSPVNLQSLTHFVKKWVVHIRDPRSVTLSWVHHTNRIYSERGDGRYHYLFVYPAPPEAYYGWPFGRQVDWNIEHFLPSVVAWTRSWLAIYDSRRYDILLTSFSELARDELGYIHKILDFYAIPPDLFRRPHVERTLLHSHFRAGLEDEWLSAFSPDQVAKATSIIGDDLIERFGWPAGPPKQA
jgi:Sulfotransferase domain